jgi:hypothetical protein
MSVKKRRSFSADFNAKKGLEAIHRVKTLNEIGRLRMELVWIKKVRSFPMKRRRIWISAEEP